MVERASCPTEDQLDSMNVSDFCGLLQQLYGPDAEVHAAVTFIGTDVLLEGDIQPVVRCLGYVKDMDRAVEEQRNART
jgi:hypothetical protein